MRGSIIESFECNLARMPDELGIADADCQCCFDLLACFLISSVHMKRPGVRIQSVDVAPSREFSARDFQRLYWFVRVVGIIKNQLTIRVVAAIGLEERLSLEFGKSFFRIVISLSKLQRFGKVIQILRMRSCLIALFEQVNRLVVSLLLDPYFRQITQRIVIPRKEADSLLEVLLGLSRVSPGEFQMRHLSDDPSCVFYFAWRRRLQCHVHQVERALNVA